VSGRLGPTTARLCMRAADEGGIDRDRRTTEEDGRGDNRGDNRGGQRGAYVSVCVVPWGKHWCPGRRICSLTDTGVSSAANSLPESTWVPAPTTQIVHATVLSPPSPFQVTGQAEKLEPIDHRRAHRAQNTGLTILKTFPSNHSFDGRPPHRLPRQHYPACCPLQTRFLANHSARFAHNFNTFAYIHDGCLLYVSCSRSGCHQGCCRF
jgi:hypothetical protein